MQKKIRSLGAGSCQRTLWVLTTLFKRSRVAILPRCPRLAPVTLPPGWTRQAPLASYVGIARATRHGGSALLSNAVPDERIEFDSTMLRTVRVPRHSTPHRERNEGGSSTIQSSCPLSFLSRRLHVQRHLHLRRHWLNLHSNEIVGAFEKSLWS